LNLLQSSSSDIGQDAELTARKEEYDRGVERKQQAYFKSKQPQPWQPRKDSRGEIGFRNDEVIDFDQPRTSPYDFQGLGVEGLQILRQVADEFDLAIISEILNPNDVEMALDYVDVIQVGARNMQNFDLLRAVGKVNKPVLLKRGLAATIDEFINAAEYIIAQGNDQIILCERGIRTYERATRNTLDISAVPILKKETHLPVIVDVTHSTGRRDLLLPTAKAALAIGADAVMAEVHPDPAVALSDSAQQMDIPEFHRFMDELKGFKNKLS